MLRHFEHGSTLNIDLVDIQDKFYICQYNPESHIMDIWVARFPGLLRSGFEMNPNKDFSYFDWAFQTASQKQRRIPMSDEEYEWFRKDPETTIALAII